ncbi:MAG: hypothetical protein K6T59_10240 [Bryobacteraceae bacterium]|nr:hypothetical protein [Bryobacteraceae bacterium]
MTGIPWKNLLATAVLMPFLLGGCGRTSGPDETGQRGDKATGKTAEAPKEGAADGQDEEAEIKAARAELSPEDQRLVEAQEFCPVMPDNRLGVMGPPLKVMVKDQPVFLCCKGCRRKALADPDRTLAKVEELKAKVKAGAGKK